MAEASASAKGGVDALATPESILCRCTHDSHALKYEVGEGEDGLTGSVDGEARRSSGEEGTA